MTRRLSKLILLLGSALALGLAAPAQADELRIGFIAPTTGIFAQIGKDMVNGFQLYLDEHGGKLGGMDVKFIVEDNQGKPDTAVTKAKKLILQDKVNMFIGGLLASTGYALAPVSTAEKTLYISSISSADDLTQRQFEQVSLFHPHQLVVVAAATIRSASGPAIRATRKSSPSRPTMPSAMNRSAASRKRSRSCGGKIIQKIWPPLGTKDFGPYIPTMKSDADAIYSLMVGPMALQFPKQLRGSGDKRPIIAGGTSYDEFVLPFMGDEVIGDVSSLHYSAAIETPANEKFVKAYRAKYGKVPSYYSENNYTTALWIDEAIKKAGGKFPGAEQFIKLMQSIKVDAPRGPVELDDMRNPIENVYIKKVEKKKMFGYPKDELWNVVIKTYPHVSQFWTYGKDKFLAQPVYSRDFPPCKFCE